MIFFLNKNKKISKSLKLVEVIEILKTMKLVKMMSTMVTIKTMILMLGHPGVQSYGLCRWQQTPVFAYEWPAGVLGEVQVFTLFPLSPQLSPLC